PGRIMLGRPEAGIIRRGLQAMAALRAEFCGGGCLAAAVAAGSPERSGTVLAVLRLSTVVVLTHRALHCRPRDQASLATVTPTMISNKRRWSRPGTHAQVTRRRARPAGPSAHRQTRPPGAGRPRLAGIAGAQRDLQPIAVDTRRDVRYLWQKGEARHGARFRGPLLEGHRGRRDPRDLRALPARREGGPQPGGACDRPLQQG